MSVALKNLFARQNKQLLTELFGFGVCHPPCAQSNAIALTPVVRSNALYCQASFETGTTFISHHRYILQVCHLQQNLSSGASASSCHAHNDKAMRHNHYKPDRAAHHSASGDSIHHTRTMASREHVCRHVSPRQPCCQLGQQGCTCSIFFVVSEPTTQCDNIQQ